MRIQGVDVCPYPAPDPVTAADGRVALAVDTSVYGLDAVMRAAYKFTDRCYVFILPAESGDRAVVTLTAKTTSGDLRALVGEFCNELLDQQLRDSLAREFGDIRTLVVAQAFSEGNLLDPDRDDGDYSSDPRGAGRRR